MTDKMPTARLEYADASGRHHVVPIIETPFKIGRSHSNGLALQNHA